MPGTTLEDSAIHQKAASARGPCPGPWTARRQFPVAGEDLECSCQDPWGVQLPNHL